MRIVLLPILFLGIIFAFASADAQLLGGVAGNCATVINNQSATGEDYCNAQKKCSKNDLITKFIPIKCKKYGLGNITLGNWEKDEDAAKVVKHFQNEGWLSDALPATEAECRDPRPYIKLQDCKSTGEIILGIRKVNGVDTCCALEVSTNIEKAREEKQKLQQAAICGGGYDYPIGKGEGKTEIEKVAGGLNINWPASPLGTPLSITETNGIAGLIKYIYDWLISLGGFAAFIALVIAGVQYLTSAGNPGKMSEAISRIRSAGIGLVLLLSSVLILNTINPRLIKIGINFEDIQTSKMEELRIGPLGGGANPCGTLCEGVYFCKKANHSDCEYKKVAEGQTEVGNLPMNVRSINFDPNDDQGRVGACSVILFQIENQKFTDNSPPSSLIINPIKDLGASFPMQSYFISDANRSSGFNLGF